MISKRPVGKTGLAVTEIGLGGASIGGLYQDCSVSAAQEVISTSLALGINYFDTAPEYGHGLSERRMGDALRNLPQDDYILSTKVGDFLYANHTTLPTDNKFINKLPFHLRFDYSYDGIMRAFEDSLQRLGLHKVNLLLVHDLDPIVLKQDFAYHFNIYQTEGYKAIARLKEEGVVCAVGLGVKQWEVCAKALETYAYDCFMLQGNYTLLEQPALAFLDHCYQQQISILLAGPFASGILATGAQPGAYFHHQPASDAILKRVQMIEEICAKHNTPLQAAAIQFPLRHPAIASVVIGAAAAQLMCDNINFYRFPIPDSLWEELKALGVILESECRTQ